ncbi:MAG: MBL fold metallo-hydrolase [Methanocellales archaeon]|nr:MBL fold metallo-hydrolase [Methanocellales archaeon]
MKIRFLGGCREVGRSAILVDGILLDYGMKPCNPPLYPLNGLRPSSIIVSHAHLDHSGVVANLMDLRPGVFMTPVTRDLSLLLAHDTLKISKRQGIFPFDMEDVQLLMQRVQPVTYQDCFQVDGYSVRLFDAGHIPGSASIHLDGEKRLLYTGDINTLNTRLLNGAYGRYPDADVLIIESTYFGRTHPNRKELERQFVESIIQTLDDGGSAILPCFAIGRTQEILMILDAYGLSPYVDGMGVDVQQVLERHPSYLRDIDELQDAFNNAKVVEPEHRSLILKEPSIIVTTAGMLNGGPVLYYLGKVHDDPRSKILLTGYQIEGTNGWSALERGYVEIDGEMIPLNMQVEYYDFSAHADDAQLKKLIKGCKNVGMVFPVHGDDAEVFAQWIRNNCSCDAIAPKNGDEIILD